MWWNYSGRLWIQPHWDSLSPNHVSRGGGGWSVALPAWCPCRLWGARDWNPRGCRGVSQFVSVNSSSRAPVKSTAKPCQNSGWQTLWCRSHGRVRTLRHTVSASLKLSHSSTHGSRGRSLFQTICSGWRRIQFSIICSASTWVLKPDQLNKYSCFLFVPFYPIIQSSNFPQIQRGSSPQNWKKTF